MRIGRPVAPPALAGADPTSEGGHAVELGPHRGHHIDTTDHHRGVGTGPKRGVQSRPALGGVHRLARQHRRDPFGHAGPVGQGQQQLDRLGSHQVAGPVDDQVARSHRQPLDPAGIVSNNPRRCVPPACSSRA